MNSEDFINKSIIKFGKFLDYSMTEYKSAKLSLILHCPKHGEFLQKPYVHLNAKYPCPKCSKNIPTTFDFINKINNSNLTFEKTIYTKDSEKVTVTCIYHGDFKILANSLIKGKGCLKCSNTDKKDLNYFIKKSKYIHKDKYDYSKSIYINNLTKITIICNIHGEFEQIPINHYKYGCIKCSGKYKKSTDEFIQLANIVHKNKYDYSLVVYNNTLSKIQVICLEHGAWCTDPSNHLSGKGCPKCSHRISKKEQLWLDKLNVKKEYRNYYLQIYNKKYFVDGYIPETNTIYEFNGDFWHGNPNVFDLTKINPITKTTFKYLYNKTITKEKIFKNAGYTVVSIWENDFDNGRE